MSNGNYDEKELRKHEEKTEEKKSYEEKHRQDPLSTVIGAFILIWIGSVLLADTLGLLEAMQLPGAEPLA